MHTSSSKLAPKPPSGHKDTRSAEIALLKKMLKSQRRLNTTHLHRISELEESHNSGQGNSSTKSLTPEINHLTSRLQQAKEDTCQHDHPQAQTQALLNQTLALSTTAQQNQIASSTSSLQAELLQHLQASKIAQLEKELRSRLRRIEKRYHKQDGRIKKLKKEDRLRRKRERRQDGRIARLEGEMRSRWEGGERLMRGFGEVGGDEGGVCEPMEICADESEGEGVWEAMEICTTL